MNTLVYTPPETRTEVRMYSGPLAEMREFEKRGPAEILEQLAKRYELHNFGVPELVGLKPADDPDVMARVMASPFWRTALCLARGHVLTVAKEKVLDVRELPIERLDTPKETLQVVRPFYTARWQVPNRDTGEPSFVYYSGFYSQTKDIARFLLHHEIDEQMLFSGVRVFDPHDL